MKKILVFILVTAMLLSLCACGNKGSAEAAVEAEAETEGAVETDAPAAAAPVPESSSAENTDEQGKLAKLWNGDWQGIVHISGSTGMWELLNDTDYDAVMTVNIGVDGKGSLQIRDPNGALVQEEDGNKFADVTCRADSDCLYGESGKAFGYTINASEWKFLRNRENPDEVTASSSFTDADGNRFGYTFTFYSPGKEPEIRVGMSNTQNNNQFEGNPRKLNINDRNVVFVTYPENRYEYDREGVKLVDLDGGASIQFNPLLGSKNFEEYKEEFGKGAYTSLDNYEYYSTNIGDFPALVCIGSDFDGAKMYVAVDFGKEYNGYYGILFTVTGKTVEECKTALVWAVINSVELRK